MLETNACGLYLGDPAMAPVLDALDHLHALVVRHPHQGFRGPARTLRGEELLTRRPELPAKAHASAREVMIMEDNRQTSRQSVVDRLRKMGFEPAAEAAGRELPDPVTYEQAAKFGERYGIFLDDLISSMGGSP
jgi:hypothetical protein